MPSRATSPLRSFADGADRARRSWLLVVALLLLAQVGGLAQAAGAAVFAPLDDAALVDQSPVIVEARVAGLEPSGTGTTRVGLEVERDLRGSHDPVGADAVGSSLVLELPAGVDAEGRMLRVSGTPLPRVGDRMLLFLTAASATPERHRLVQHGLGAFSIVAIDGRRVALRELDGAARDADRFVEWIEARLAGREAADPSIETEIPAKYRRERSSTEPFPLGCGSAGGHALRVAAFDHGGVFGWRSYFLGSPDLDQGGITALRRALAAWRDDPLSFVDIRHAGLASAPERALYGADGTNLVAFEDPFDEIPGTWEHGGMIAVTASWFDCVRFNHRGRVYHPILEADVVFQDGLAPLFASAPSAERLAEQLLGRQLGLALGFALSGDPDALLAQQPHDDPRGALLGVDDLHGLSVVYSSVDRPLLPPQGRPLGVRGHVGLGAVELTWIDDVEGESLFRVERRQVAAEDGTRLEDPPFEPVGYAPADAESYVDHLVYSGRLYEYRLVSVNGRADGASSTPLEVQVPVGAGLPAAPSVLRGAAVSPTRVRLTWRDNACDEDDQRLHVQRPDGVWEEVPFMLPRELERVVVDGLEPGRTYRFRLVAQNAFGASPTSNEAVVTTPAVDAPCLPDAETLCLFGGRFEVRAVVEDPVVGRRPAHAAALDDATGSFWFFQADNPELVVEIVGEGDGGEGDGGEGDGGEVGLAVRRGVLTTLGHEITVTDTATGATTTYDGSSCSGTDRLGESPGPPEATPPPPLPDVPFKTAADLRLLVPEPVVSDAAAKQGQTDVPSCFLRPTELSLFDDRFHVTLETVDELGRRVAATAIDAGERAGHFTFGSASTGAVDWTVKILDGRAVNGAYWLFHGPVGDGLETWLVVEDRLHGTLTEYHRSAGESCSQIDLDAFPG